MNDFRVGENEDVFLDFPLKYGQAYRPAAKRGLLITKADVTEIYVQVAATEDGVPFITLTTANAGIVWLDSNDAESSVSTCSKISAKFGTNTAGRSGDNQWFEVKIKFTDGSMVVPDKGHGHFHITPSIVDRGA